MYPEQFDALLKLVEAKISKQDTTWRNSISARKRLVLTIRLVEDSSYIAIIMSIF